jgi:NADPH:quinone reductase-like Zn-dependent oxidoreductase
MKSVQIDSFGDINTLHVRDLPDASCTHDGAVLIRQVASSLNPVDWKTREWGLGPSLPMTLGWDVAGIVVESRSTDFAVGDRVISMSKQVATGTGAWSDLVELDGSIVARAPHNLSLVHGAALPLTAMTARIAWRALSPKPGARVLVTGVLGGVGRIAAQLGVANGYRIDGLVRPGSPQGAALVLGVERVLTDPVEAGEDTYDAVLDTASIDPGSALWAGGRYVSITDDPLPNIRGAVRAEVYEDGAILRSIVEEVERGVIQPRVAAMFDALDVKDAHRRFEAGGTDGKVILLF